jgi:frataxin-like iron-binding protein CyaY
MKPCFLPKNLLLTKARTKMLSLVLALLFLWFSSPVCGYRPRNSFQHWFPDVEEELSSIVANNCSEELQAYLD